MFFERNSVTDLEKDLAKFEADTKSAADTIAGLRQRRPQLLVTGSDEDLKKHDEQYAKAQREHERATARKADTEQRLTIAREEVAKIETDALRKEAEAAAKEAASAVKKAFADIQKAAAKAIEKLVAANHKVAQANSRRSEADEPVGSVEGRVVAVSNLPEETLSEKTVVRWVYEQSGAEVSKVDLPNIIVDKDDAFHGKLRSEWRTSAGEISWDKVACRRFIEREYLPRVRGRAPSDLTETLKQIVNLTFIEELQDDRSPQFSYSPGEQTAETSEPPTDAEQAEDKAA